MTRTEWFGGQYLGDGKSRLGTHVNHGFDPATGSTLPGEFVDATLEEVERAGNQSADAYSQLIYARSEAIATFLDMAAGKLDQTGTPIVERAAQETALGVDRLSGELARTTDQLRMFGSMVRDGSWEDVRVDAGAGEQGRPDLRRTRIGVGPVAVFGASNFPLAFSVAGGDTASAIAAGCPVIVKAHPSHPGTSELVAEVLVDAVQEAGLPPATFQMIHGADNRISQALVQNPSVRAVGFTGSLAGGMALKDAARARIDPIPVFAEMGSLNPIVIFPQAMANRGSEVAEQVAGSVRLGVGQFCTKPGVVIAKASEDFDAWGEELAKILAAGDPQPMLNERIAQTYVNGLKVRADLPSVEPIGRRVEATGAAGKATAFRVTGAAFLGNRVLREELFGPTTLLVGCGDDQELANVVAAMPGSLTVTVHADAQDYPAVRSIWHLLVDRAGRVVFNGVPTGVTVSPAMNHGGPFPATTDSRFTSVGTAAVERFSRGICFQDVPTTLLPFNLQNGPGSGD